MAGARSAQTLMKAPSTSYQPMYNPDTAQQYAPGTVLPGTNILQSLTTPGGLEAATGLKTGWAPKIGHITTSAATNRRRSNPLLAAPIESAKRKNPFIVPQTPSADLFGLNIPT